jgi:hypothetical protein
MINAHPHQDNNKNTEETMSKKRTPDKESTETSTAVVEPTAAEAATDKPSFADQVGKKSYPAIPDPFGVAADYAVGVRLYDSRQDRQVALKFGEGRPEDKPSQAVIDMLKEAGYRWNPQDKIWAHPVRGESAMSTRIEAEQLFQEIAKMIRQEKGIEAGPEIPR